MMKIFLYGPPGSGKSSSGKILAESQDIPYIDLDDRIVESAGQSIPEIFSSRGESAFREIESQTLIDLKDIPSAVIALGGGALLDERNRTLAESCGEVVCLRSRLETILKRLSRDENQRPLLSGDMEYKLRDLLEKRADHYASFSRRIDTDGLSPDEAAWQISIICGYFHIRGMGQPYDVRVMEGQLSGIGQALGQYKLKGPAALVMDHNVAKYYGDDVEKSLTGAGFTTRKILAIPGEISKNIGTVAGFWNEFVEGGLERGSTVIALGGGVIGDMAGFAASTYMRGIPWVCVPTSLLAMVDSSLGGKTAVDLPRGKNLVGTFHAPRLVWADPQTLNTLPESELRNGLAEVLKHGVIGDPGLLEMVASGWNSVKSNLSEIVRRAIAVKARVILQDPYEKGLRQVLNFGHTIGHGVEIASNFSILHGEAVAIGMVASTRIAEKIGLADNGLADYIEKALVELGLPVSIPEGMDTGTVKKAMQTDKKRSAGKLRFALPVRPGEMKYGIEVQDWDQYIG